MKIYLMRHGIAHEPADADFEVDSQRPLTAKGREHVTRIARALRKLGVKPDLILASPYVRAEQTADILSKEFDLKKHLILSELLVPEGKAEDIIGTIVENFMADELLIVSHEPCLSLLTSFLVAADLNLAINIRKGGVCCLEAVDLRLEPRASLEWLLTPKILLKV
ncbi:MAG TPA: phosphohistidine phosphatase SixA [Anaerolineaceae bacterium]